MVLYLRLSAYGFAVFLCSLQQIRSYICLGAFPRNCHYFYPFYFVQSHVLKQEQNVLKSQEKGLEKALYKGIFGGNFYIYFFTFDTDYMDAGRFCGKFQFYEKQRLFPKRSHCIFNLSV